MYIISMTQIIKIDIEEMIDIMRTEKATPSEMAELYEISIDQIYKILKEYYGYPWSIVKASRKAKMPEAYYIEVHKPELIGKYKRR